MIFGSFTFPWLLCLLLCDPDRGGVPPVEPSAASALAVVGASTPTATKTTMKRFLISLTFFLRAYGVS
jgi:hypothetical protein